MRAPTADLDLTARPQPLGRLLGDVWRSRHLVAMLARKDFLVRYRRTSFGLLWAAALPLLQAVVLAIVFSRVARFHVGTHYAVFVFAAVLPWSLFSSTLLTGSTSIVDNSGLASKIYFPRILLPLIVVAGSAYAFLAGVVVLLGMCLVLGTGLGWHLVFLPVAVLLLALHTTAITVLISGLHVYFRDLRYVVQATILAWFYVTPVVYPIGAAPPGLRAVVRANPMTGVVEAFRYSVDGGAEPNWPSTMLVTVVVALVLGAVGVDVQRRRDRRFADLL